MTRTEAIEKFRAAERACAEKSSVQRNVAYAAAADAMREFVADNESRGALLAGVTFADIKAALAAAWGDATGSTDDYFPRYDSRPDIAYRRMPSDDALQLARGDSASRLAELVQTIGRGAVGAAFVTNRRRTVDCIRRELTLHINARPVAVIRERRDGAAVYLLDAEAGEWIYWIHKTQAREAAKKYAIALTAARSAVELALSGRDGEHWYYTSGQEGGTLTGSFGTVSARGAGFPYELFDGRIDVVSAAEVADAVRLRTTEAELGAESSPVEGLVKGVGWIRIRPGARNDRRVIATRRVV